MPFEPVGAWTVLDKRNKNTKNQWTLPLLEKDAIQALFNIVKNNEVDSLHSAMASLDSLQRSKYFTARLPFESSWARGLEEMTLLQYACFLGHEECVKSLLASKASLFDYQTASETTYRNSLHFAVDSGHSSIALLLLEHGAKDHLAVCVALHGFRKYHLPSEPRSCFTHLLALHMAVLLNMYEVTEAILIGNKDIIFTHASGNTTALHLAVRNGQDAMIRLLESHGASTLWEFKDFQGKSPRELS